MFKKPAMIGLVMTMLLSLWAAPLQAQSFNASIRGSVTDPSGATVPNVELLLTAVETGAISKHTTGPDGAFAFLNLATGNYELKAAAAGFREFVQKGIELKMNAVTRVDIRLEVGATQQTIEVQADVSQLNFETPTVQSGIAPEVLGELPLIVSGSIRSAAAFVTLMPGASQGASQNPYNTRINGGLTAGDEAVWDGVSLNEGINGNTGMIAAYSDYPMSPEAISEISVLTSNYEPQYGVTTSGVITAETKAGTKNFHGSLYEFHRNTVLNARQFGIPRESRPKDIENDYGGSLGGPIKIPKIFDTARKKSYFFFNYEGFKIRGGVSTPILSLPTMQERQGDFSDWVDSDGNLIPVYDPATTRLNPAYNPDLPPSKENGKYLRDQFMGCDGKTPNVICRTDPRLQNPLAAKWLQFLPSPTLPGVRNNYVVPQPIPDSVYADSSLINIRVDQYWRDKDHFFVSVNYRGAKPSTVSLLPPQLSQQQPYYTNYSFVNRANWTHTFSPTLLNHFAIGYLNTHTAQWPYARPYGKDLPQIPGVPSHEDPTVLYFDDFAGFGNNQVGTDSRPSWIANDLITWVRGNHTFKFGGEIRKHGNNSVNYIDESGTLNFSRLSTGLSEFTSGNSMASFLLGQVAAGSYNIDTVTSQHPRASAYNFHFGDTYKVTPKLTLTLGIRWDLFKPPLEKFDYLSFLDPNGANPAAGNLPGRLAFAGTKWGAASYGARYPEQLWKKGFAPRVGVAYAINDKTVIRTGYGIFYSSPIYPGWSGGIAQDGFNTTVNFNSTRDGYDPAFLLENGFPEIDASLKPPFIDPSFRNGGSVNYRPLDANRLPYAQQWNLTIERQFTQNLVVNAAYVANKGTRLPSRDAALNALNPKYLALGDKLYEEFQEGQAALNGIPLPYQGWWEQMTNANCLPTVAQALRPYPQYCSDLQGQNENAGNSTYHSFQLKVEHRMSRGMYLLGTYTLSKLLTSSEGVQMDYASYGGANALGVISPYERKRNKALAMNDVPQSFIFAFIYDLPFGQGKRFLNRGGVADKILGGWQMNNIFRATSGVPMWFRSFQCNVPGEFRAMCIPAINPGANPFAQDKSNFDPNQPLFNAGAFESKDSFNFYWGQGPRVSNIRGFGYHNHDLSLLKSTRISERVNLQIRAEFFNVWNWHCFTSRGGEGQAWNGFSIFDTDVSGATFGMWNGEVSDPRNIQVGVKLIF
jgi:hypothetical protein